MPMPFHLSPRHCRRIAARAVLVLLLAAGALPAGGPARAQDFPAGDAAGAYLAAGVAMAGNDFAAAAGYYDRALAADPANPGLLAGAVTARVALGEMAAAADLAQRLDATGETTPAAQVALIAAAAQGDDHDRIIALVTAGKGQIAVLDDLVLAWAEVGRGQMSEATARFDKIAAASGLEAFGLYHKALALASAGDFEGADAILSGRAAGAISVIRRGVIAHLQILSQLEKNAEAVALIDRTFPPGADIEIDDLRRRLAAGEPIAYDVARNAREGIAEVFFSLATAVNGQADDVFTLLHARAAMALRPDNTEALLLVAELLETMSQQELAATVFAAVPKDSPAFYIAEIGRANTTHAGGDTEGGLDILRALGKSHPGILAVQIALGDGLRRESQFAEARLAYDAAIAMVTEPGPEHWTLFFARGVALERTGDFAAAEADLRLSLQLQPDNAQVLNYLGYSLVDRGQKLDEALAMIQKAVDRQPNNGAILDSLAWAYFRLGRYDEALAPQEAASLLEPVDPVVTDHLGDIYWMVGRRREAEYQWHRALSFAPEEKDALRIRAKLEKGLEAVMADEAAGLAPAPADAGGND